MFTAEIGSYFQILDLGLKGNSVKNRSCPRNCKPGWNFHSWFCQYPPLVRDFWTEKADKIG